jgi:hypothetical protein
MGMFNNEHGAWYYLLFGSIAAATPIPLLWGSYLCASDKEYFPLTLLVIWILCSWFTAFNLFRKTREIKLRTDKQ